MTKKILAALLVLSALFIGLWSTQTASAYSGVSGAAFDGYGDPWQHGFTVYLVGTVGGSPGQLLNAPAGTAIPAGTHNFNVNYGTTPDNGTNVTIVIVFADGGVGTPQTQQYTNQFTEFSFISGAYSLGNTNTGIGPTAVTLISTGVTSANGVAMYAIIAVLLAVMGTAVIIVRRNQTA